MEVGVTRRRCEMCGAEAEIPVDTLAALAAAPHLIAEAVASAPKRRGQGWSPGEVAAHLADVELAFSWRLRQAIADDEPEVQSFDQDRWAEALRYAERDVGLSLNAFTAARAANVELLRMLDEAGWQRRFRHPEFGRRSVRVLAEHISHHDLLHFRQIQGE
jgi:hypothetical protein